MKQQSIQHPAFDVHQATCVASLRDEGRTVGMRSTIKTVLLAIALVALAACGKQEEHHFSTGSDALASDLAKRGGVPDFVPPKARNVHVLYDAHSKEAWLAFEADLEDAWEFVGPLPPVPTPDLDTVQVPDPNRPWWFEGFSEATSTDDTVFKPMMFKANTTVIIIASGGPGIDRVFIYMERV